MDLAGITVVDAHIHQWDPLTTPREFSGVAKLFKYLPLPVDVAKRLAPRRDREFAGDDPTPFVHPYLPADYRDDAGELPVEAIVHIEVEWAGRQLLAQAEETRWVASLPFGVDTPALGAIVGAADPSSPAFAQLLDAHRSASPKFRGIRSHVDNHPDSGVRSRSAPGVLTSHAFLDGFAALADRELSFDAWVYSQQLPEVTALAARYPEATIVLDHLGTPAGIFGPVGKHTGRNPSLRRELFLRWRDDLTALAANPNTVAKVSGLMMPILGHPLPQRGTPTSIPDLVDRISPLLHHAYDVFGPDRLLWGSNFPVDKTITSIPNAADAIATALTDHGADTAALERVFRRTAERVYGVDDF
ncbi:amidohydrolase family protein [Nocardia sp. 2]|uniref:Amidohydrolase family protein n=1 Tax=Nocardia acididurans TaxID=2802282 RepID=A0ABS1M310_9NOCA|nr:amidohydrolase family protein [Nocardia acididurans]MBL1074911.1 amidohydrolase family protein [Nocardia acididurans]